MSENTGAGGDKPAAPAAPAAPPPGAQPSQNAERLQAGISPGDALAELSKRRQRQPRQAARTPPPSPPPHVAVNGHQVGETAAAQMGEAPNGAARVSEPAAPAEPAADPVQRLIDSFRRPGDAPVTPSDGQATAESQPVGDNATITLNIGGRVQQFTPEQLANHVNMSADYTRKAQELATLNKQVNERAEAINQMLPVLVPEIQRQIAALDAQIGQQIDWQKLAATDPAEYQRQDALWKAAQAERQRLADIQTLQQREITQQQQQKASLGHAELAKVLPGWEDPNVRGRIQSEMIRWGRQQGFPDTELNQIYEPRHIVALFKAMAFDRMMGGVRNDAPVVPQVRQRGVSPPPPQQPAQQSAETAFNANPSIRNAVSLLNARRRTVN